MNSLRLLALAACTSLATPSFALTFSNSWSFVDLGTGQTVGGTISGLVNGINRSADGLTITVTQSPYATMLGEYVVNFGAGSGFIPERDYYSASNGVITAATFTYTNEIGEFLTISSGPPGPYYPQLVSYSTGDLAYNDVAGVRFSALTAGVPEPETWALMVGGFGLVGAAMRRRRLSVSFS